MTSVQTPTLPENSDTNSPSIFSFFFGRFSGTGNPKRTLSKEETNTNTETVKASNSFKETWKRHNNNNRVPGTIKQIRGTHPLTFKEPGNSSPLLNSSSSPPQQINRPLSNSDPGYSAAPSPQSPPKSQSDAIEAKFDKILSQPTVNLDDLKSASWTGIPPRHRCLVWKLLLGYIPTNSERRSATLERKRKEYHQMVQQYYYVDQSQRSEAEQSLYRQIHIDVPRTNPDTHLFQLETTQNILERILYIWAIRHPASGYVQGINDLVTPFLIVFLAPHVEGEVEESDISKIPTSILEEVEADAFWCISKFIAGIQDHYTFAQPGIQRMIFKLQEICRRIDEKLHSHLVQYDLKFLQFAFRWMNCLLLRELPLRLVIRLWDTYLAEGKDFHRIHVYFCAAFLINWSEQLRCRDFQDAMLFLQNLPTDDWDLSRIEVLISLAFTWKTLYHDAPSHLVSNNSNANEDGFFD